MPSSSSKCWNEFATRVSRIVRPARYSAFDDSIRLARGNARFGRADSRALSEGAARQ